MKRTCGGVLLLVASLANFAILVGCGAPDVEDRSQSLQAAEAIPSDPRTEVDCICYVRCSDAKLSQCKMTEIKKLGAKSHCNDAGRVYCTNHKYAYWKGGCKLADTEPNGCSCDPGDGGHCSPTHSINLGSK